MRLDYDNLQKISLEVRSELIKRGAAYSGKRRFRKKPRDAEKLDLLYRMSIDRLDRYPVYRDGKGRIVLPYFSLRLRSS